MKTRTVSLGVLIACAALISAIVGIPAGQAADPVTRTLTLKETTKGETFAHIRNTKGAGRQSMLTGDLIVFTNPVVDAAGKKVGRLAASCTAVLGNKNFLKAKMACDVTYLLTDGVIYATSTFAVSEPSVAFAVVGGTGAYANARGTGTSTENKDGSAVDTLTLVN